MAVYITMVHLEGGTRHEHITKVRWENRETSATGENSKAEMVKWIEDGGDCRVANGASYVKVGVVEPASGPKYLRTYADGKWTDNLLALPRY